MAECNRESYGAKLLIDFIKKLWHSQYRILILLDLIQDLDLAIPLIKEVNSHSDLSLNICVTNWLFNESPRVKFILESISVPYSVVSRRAVKAGIQPSLYGIDALVTLAETTANPHKCSHETTKRANRLGIKTYTVQHGFENIGLTYFDERYTPEAIQIASQNILIWGELDTLSPDILLATKQRCIPIGCLKEVPQNTVDLKIKKEYRHIIVVLENLHWDRYDDIYKKKFLEHLESTATSFPNTAFLVKPHHAGQWLTNRYKGDIPKIRNIIIADPKKSQWERYTAPTLIQIADGVITTPSTVALDAALLDCPVSVVSYGLPLEKYFPLTLLNNLDDWHNFIRHTQQSEGRIELKKQTYSFMTKNIVPGNAARKIVNLVLRDLNN